MATGAGDREIVEVKLPQLGETVAEGTVVAWLKAPGDRVEEDEPLCEISTDKVNSDLPSPASGEIVERVAEEGETVEVGSVLARIAVAEPADAGEAREAPAAGPGAGESSRTDAPEAEERPHFEDSSISLWGGSGAGTGDGAGAGPGDETAAEGAPAPDGARDEAPAASGGASRRGGEARHSPAVKALARREGVVLAKVEGTGREGRVTREDVRRHLEERTAGEEATKPDGRREELSPVRRVISQRLSQSTSEIPHSTTVMEADLSPVADLRERERAAFEDREGVALTYLPFVGFATLRALEAHPKMNAVFDGDAIRYRPEVNLGVAVATEQGLMVPVVRGAARLEFPELARAMSEAADGARSGTLSPRDVQGGTFTITNHGRGGSLLGTPIIVPGQTAILGVGKIHDAAVVVDGEITARKRCYLSLSFDHRTADGAEADAFLRTLVDELEAFDPAVVAET